MLTLRNIRKRFGATIALDGVDLDVADGEVHALIGENGAGKSTLMNVLSGTTAPDEGEMRAGGQKYEPRGPCDARVRGIAHIHQELALCHHLSVSENIWLGDEPASRGWLDARTMKRRTEELLADFGRDDISPDAAVGSLPLADRQVVEICRALARRSSILLMDEPTSSLQRSNVDRLFRLIRNLRDRGLTVVYISHFLEEVREIASRYTVLRDGRSVATGELADTTDSGLIAAMTGREVDLAFQKGDRRSEIGDRGRDRSSGVQSPDLGSPISVLLEVRDLCAPPRLKKASFELRPGEVFGIAGLIGAGRTELVRAIFSLQPATGEVLLRGRALRVRDRPSDRIRAGFGYLSEDRKGEGLALPLSAADNITMSRFGTCSRAGWIDAGKQRRQASAIMQTLNVRASGPQARVLELSGGNQQKIAMGRLLHQDPDVLLLDEPTRGVDVGSKSDIHREIRRLAASGKSILMVGSYLPELLGVCDRIAVMTRGVLGPARRASEWTAESIMEASVLG